MSDCTTHSFNRGFFPPYNLQHFFQFSVLCFLVSASHTFCFNVIFKTKLTLVSCNSLHFSLLQFQSTKDPTLWGNLVSTVRTTVGAVVNTEHCFTLHVPINTPRLGKALLKLIHNTMGHFLLPSLTLENISHPSVKQLIFFPPLACYYIVFPAAFWERFFPL